MIMLAFSVIPASFVLFLIDEKTSQAKHLQLVSGADPNIYWATNFLWDMVYLESFQQLKTVKKCFEKHVLFCLIFILAQTIRM